LNLGCSTLPVRGGSASLQHLTLPNLYSTAFYRKQRSGSLSSAEIVLSRLFDLVRPTSVLDFGDGVGTWLAAAKKLSAQRAIGYEGDWVRPKMLMDADISLRHADLVSSHPVDEGVDLAIASRSPNTSPKERGAVWWRICASAPTLSCLVP